MVKSYRCLSTGEGDSEFTRGCDDRTNLDRDCDGCLRSVAAPRSGWGPGVAAGVIGGVVIAGAIIASRPQGYVVYPGYAQPVSDPGATGHPSLSTTLQAALSAIPANQYRSALAMLRLRRPPPPNFLLRPRQNDRVSRRIKSQRSSDKLLGTTRCCIVQEWRPHLDCKDGIIR